MYSMIIVDDEPIIRQGIKTSIDWSSYGINITAEARDGKDALEKVMDLKPDILITDIRMPVMDGLELAEEIKEKNIDTKVIILSGYDDFQYAQKSIGLNVVDYLLKPFGAEELIDMVIRLKKTISSERQKKETFEYNKILMQENMDLIQSKFIKRLLTKKYTDYSYIYNKAEVMNIYLDGPFYQVALIDIDDFFILSENMNINEKDLMINSIINLASTKVNDYNEGIICKSDSDYLICLLNLPTETSSIIKLCQQIQQIISDRLNLSLTIGIGEISSDLSELSNSYKEALLALRKKVNKGKGSIIEYNNLQDHEKNKPVFYPNNKERELLNELRLLNKNIIMDMLDILFTQFSNEEADYSNIKNITLRIVLMAQGLLEEMGINIEKELQTDFKPYNDIEKYETIEDIKLWIKELFKTFIVVIQKNRGQKYNNIINSSLQYVKDHYSEGISLNDIANHVYVTPNYFSKIFKEETGENFTIWLNKYRIEKAKSIIKENKDIKCYKVSDMVGYNDYKYFSTIFKKFTNMTPSQFKSQL